MSTTTPIFNVANAALAFGLAVGAAAALVAFLVVRALAAVPTEDRTYRDQPPLGFRLLWWPIQWLSFYAGRWLPATYRQSTLRRLRQAGLDYTLSPEQFVAAQFTVAILAVLTVQSLAPPGSASLAWSSAAAGVGIAYPALWRRNRVEQRRRVLLKQLPFYLDIVTLCVEAGLNLTGAMEQAMSKGPPGALHDEIARILRDLRAGKPRLEALRDWAQRMNESTITNLVSALIQAETMGVSLGPILRAQAEQRRAERFARAEKLAMEAPVKMLFPLIAFIFPCTFVVIGFPIVMKFLMLGL